MIKGDGSDRYTLAGVTSWLVWYCKHFPAVYARVTEALPWIRNETGIAASCKRP